MPPPPPPPSGPEGSSSEEGGRPRPPGPPRGCWPPPPGPWGPPRGHHHHHHRVGAEVGTCTCCTLDARSVELQGSSRRLVQKTAKVCESLRSSSCIVLLLLPQGNDAPACELRPLFRVPEKFNFSARVQCFERWEREQAKEMGMAPEDRMDMTSKCTLATTHHFDSGS